MSAGVAAIGLDSGDQTSQSCPLGPVGEVRDKLAIATTRRAMERKFGESARTRVGLESGPQASGVHDLPVSTGHEAVVARRVRPISRSALTAKTRRFVCPLCRKK